MAKRLVPPGICCDQPPLANRSLLSPIEAGGLAVIFKVLANDTRLRLLHALALSTELAVNELSKTVAMKPQAVSNQLHRLSDLGIVSSRRQGKSIRYSLVDLCVRSLLEQALCLMGGVAARGFAGRGSPRP